MTTLEQVPFGNLEFADNPEPRCACLLLLDTSGSMQGAKIEQLNAGLKEFARDRSAAWRGQRQRDAGRAPQTPFGQLLMGATLGRGGHRSLRFDVPTNPAVLMRSWVTLPLLTTAKPG